MAVSLPTPSKQRQNNQSLLEEFSLLPTTSDGTPDNGASYSETLLRRASPTFSFQSINTQTRIPKQYCASQHLHYFSRALVEVTQVLKDASVILVAC
ncbi:hypothetical protein E2C01_088311 [Portunus trituberculatus]|uniref:Uncharacterized protein n=1 Tax=Portunus trituberculatus TaxID=210409 RepID=A0A5B7JE47_PORTR|nr:hypothetical protein [Portunus trituberculatus]